VTSMLFCDFDDLARGPVAVFLVSRLYRPDPSHRVLADVALDALVAPPVGIGVSAGDGCVEFGPATWPGWIAAAGAVYFESGAAFFENGCPESLGDPSAKLLAFRDFGRVIESTGGDFDLGTTVFSLAADDAEASGAELEVALGFSG